MWLRAIQRRWCPCSGIVFVCVFLAMVVFIAFEVLDLDGSDVQHLPGSAAIAAEPTLADVEQILPQCNSVLAAHSRVLPCLDPRLRPEAVKLLRPLGGISLIVRLDQARPRSFLRRETSPPTPLSDDPA